MKFTAVVQSSKRSLALGPMVTLLALVLSLFAMTPGHSLATTYYVDQSHSQASDSNTGTETLPWKTLYKAAKTLVAGDTVLVKAGTYVATGGAWNTPAINPANSGAPGKPITFKAYAGHQVILDTQGQGNAIGADDRDYIVIDGFTIPYPGGGAGIVVFGSSSLRIKGVVVQNNTIYGVHGSAGNNSPGIRLEYTSGVLVRSNRIFDVRNEAEAYHNAAAILMYSNDNAIIENNEIYDVNAGIFEKDNGMNNTFRKNFVHDCREFGIGIYSHNGRTHRDDKAYNNIVTRCSTGIRVTGSSSSPNFNSLVYNNTVTSNSTGIGVDTDISNTQVWNNIIYSGNSGNLTSSNPSLGYCDYNLYHLTPTGCGAHSLAVNPQFVSTAFQKPGDFKLQSSSPAQGTGRNGEDIGAYATGNEVIGLTSSPQDTIPPEAPTGLSVQVISSQ